MAATAIAQFGEAIIYALKSATTDASHHHHHHHHNQSESESIEIARNESLVSYIPGSIFSSFRSAAAPALPLAEAIAIGVFDSDVAGEGDATAAADTATGLGVAVVVTVGAGAGAGEAVAAAESFLESFVFLLSDLAPAAAAAVVCGLFGVVGVGLVVPRGDGLEAALDGRELAGEAVAALPPFGAGDDGLPFGAIPICSITYSRHLRHHDDVDPPSRKKNTNCRRCDSRPFFCNAE